MDYKSAAVKLETLSRDELKRAAKILKVPKFGNKNKTELISAIMEGGKKQLFRGEYDAEDAILKVREALGLTTDPRAGRTKGIRKSFKDEAKSPKELATEAMAAMRKAMAQTHGKPKLKKQFIARMKKEMDEFEADIEKIKSKKPAVEARKAARASYKDSAQLKQDL